jgi:hypothetical protein
MQIGADNHQKGTGDISRPERRNLAEAPKAYLDKMVRSIDRCQHDVFKVDFRALIHAKWLGRGCIRIDQPVNA